MDSRAHQTCKEMLEQRGFTVVQEEEDVIMAQGDGGTSVIVFSNRDSVSIASIKDYVNFMNGCGIKHAIIVYKKTITPQAKKTIENITDMEIETFQEECLLFNITKHSLVPQHVRLTDLEAVVFKNMYSSKLPIIKTSDPVSRFYNFKSGDVIKILRRDGIPSYRIVK
jgi:DNA-directed RNA polymerase I, II, and III subunit RPABC1